MKKELNYKLLRLIVRVFKIINGINKMRRFRLVYLSLWLATSSVSANDGMSTTSGMKTERFIPIELFTGAEWDGRYSL